MTPALFLEVAQELAEKLPEGATLHKNQVGNLAIEDSECNYIGWVDLRNGMVMIFDETE